MIGPMYRQIAEDLRSKIDTGELARGAQLPTELQLREQYGPPGARAVSRNTVRDAVELLVSDGLVEKRPGQGTFVVQKIEPFITTLSGNPEGGESAAYRSQVASHGLEPQETKPRVEIHEASIAPELKLGKDDEVVSRHQQRRINGMPYSLQTSFYPRDFVQRGAELLDKAGEIEEGAVEYIRKTIGVEQVAWREENKVRVADSTESTFFNLPPKGGIPVVEARRTGFDKKGKRIRLTITIYASDRNVLVYEAGTLPKDEGDSAVAHISPDA